MGWLLVRPDGTIRAWNRNAQDDTPEPGETWHEWEDFSGDLRGHRWDGAALVPCVPPPPAPTPLTIALDHAMKSPAADPALVEALAALKQHLTR